MYLIKNGEKVKISSIENYDNYSKECNNNYLLYILLVFLFLCIIIGTILLIKHSNKSKPRPSFRCY